MFKKVFIWLFIGFLLTFSSSFLVVSNIEVVIDIFRTVPMLIYVMFFIPIIIAVLLSGIIKKIPVILTMILYVIYCLITGISMGAILLTFTLGSVISCLIATSIIFLICAFISWNSDYDFSSWEKILLFSLLGAIVVGLLNLFIFQSEIFEVIINSIITAIFVGYMLYDVNRIKQEQFEEDKNLPIQLAFQLYLDLINLFIKLLQLFGKRK